jgi:branched-chain amino acid transport system substrate-binding protein
VRAGARSSHALNPYRRGACGFPEQALLDPRILIGNCSGAALIGYRRIPMSMLRLRSFLGFSLLLSLVFAASAQAQEKTIKIASQSPLSGGQAALGEGIKLGTQLAVEKFKGNLEKQGFKVVLVPYDDQAKPDVGVANAKNIIADEQILGVIGHLNSGVAIPSSEVYKDVSLAMISPANTNPTVTDRGYKNVYRVCGRDDVQGVVGSEFAHGTLKVKSVYIVHDKTTYGQGVAEFFKADAEKKGVKVLGFEGTEERSNFDPIITPIKARNPDLIYFGGIYEQAAPFFKAAREKGVKSKFIGPDGMDSSDLAKIGGKAVVGMYYTSVAGPVTVYPKAKAFADEYKAKFGKNPEPFAAQSYDATAILILAVEKAMQGGKAPTREAVSAAIRDVKYDGVTGSIVFDGKGDPKQALYFVLQVVSPDPQKWGENKEVKRLSIAAPGPKA